MVGFVFGHTTVTVASYVQNWPFVSVWVGGALHTSQVCCTIKSSIYTTVEHDTKKTSFTHCLRYIGNDLMIFHSTMDHYIIDFWFSTVVVCWPVYLMILMFESPTPRMEQTCMLLLCSALCQCTLEFHTPIHVGQFPTSISLKLCSPSYAFPSQWHQNRDSVWNLLTIIIIPRRCTVNRNATDY